MPAPSNSRPAPDTSQQREQRPWWREPMMWLVLGGPAIVVVAGLTTVWIAARAPDPVIDRDYYRRGIEMSQGEVSPAMRPAREARNHAATPDQGYPKPTAK